MPRKCYLLSMPKINNPEQFGKYFAAASATFPKTGMRVLAAADTDSALCAERDTAQTTSKAVLVEFDSKEAAMAWWNSEEYQSTVADRHESTTGGLLIAEGVDESDGLPMIENPKAFLMAFVKFTSDKIMEYPPKVPATLEGYGGYVMRAIFPKGEGEVKERETAKDFDLGVVLGFKDGEAAMAWKNSDAYKAIVDIRLDNSTGPLVIANAA